MYSRDTLVLLQHYLDLGLNKTAIARQLGVSLRAIHYWIDTGQLDREVDPVTPRRPARRAQQLDPFRALIDERLATYPALSAVRLFDECRAAGYPGGITQLRDYVMHVRGALPSVITRRR
jgi:transposase